MSVWFGSSTRGFLTLRHSRVYVHSIKPFIISSIRSDSLRQKRSSYHIMSSVDKILHGKYPAKAHARRVADYLIQSGFPKDGVIYLEAQKQRFNEDNDQEQHFRQRRPFFYLSGCLLPDSYLTYNISSSILTLFIPPIDPDDVVWSGLPLTVDEAKAKYDVDVVLPSIELNATLASHANSAASTIYAISTQVSDHVTFLPFPSTEFSILKRAIEDCRVVKDDYEVAMIRKANDITTLAHTAVVRQASTGSAKNEQELEATFLATCISHGLKEQAYHSICAAGTAAATLHYVKNDAPLAGKLNMLLDAGAEYDCYAADVTRTFPVNGEKFSKESQEIYDTVLEMQEECFGMIKAGVRWEDVHEKAHKVAITRLKGLGLLVGNEQELFDKRISTAFFPHGLGHYLGMDTHDTGGNANYADTDPMFRYLRVRGTLPAGCVITVEPGVYFCKFIIEPFLEDREKSKYINKDVLARYWEVGGVRIEDNVFVTDIGFDNLTTTPKL